MIEQSIVHLPQVAKGKPTSLCPFILCTYLDDEERAALERVVRAGVGTYYHPVGTCRMGLEPETGAVVDAVCRAHGIERLMVVDASVMPEIPAANTNVPTIMVAEQVSAWLR
jgi:choline dehydrogenase